MAGRSSGCDQLHEGGARAREGLGIHPEDRVQLGRAGHAVRAHLPFPAPDVRDALRLLELLLALLERRGQALLLGQGLGQLARAGLDAAAQHAVPDDGRPARGHDRGQAEAERPREVAPGAAVRRDHEVLLDEMVEPARLVQPVQGLPHPGELRPAALGRGQRVGHGAQGQLGQLLQAQVPRGRAQGEPVAGGAGHGAVTHGLQRVGEVVGGDHLRPAARVQLTQQREGQRPRGHGHADARELVDAPRSVGAVREHDLLLEGPGLRDQVVPARALLGEGKADEVHPARVQVLQHRPPVLQTHVDPDAGLLAEGTDQLDVEPAGRALRIHVFVGRERRVSAVHDGDGDGTAGLRLRPRPAQREDAQGQAARGPSPLGRRQEGRR